MNERRLHWSSMLFNTIAMARAFIVPSIFAIVAAKSGGFEKWIFVLFVPGIVVVLVSHYFFHYEFLDDELVVRKGMLFRSERHVPYARIENVDCKQGPLHRLFGVGEVTLQNASGSEPEAVFRVLQMSRVEEMRRIAGREQIPEGDDPVPAHADILRCSTVELVKLSFVTFRGFAMVGIIIGALWQADVFESFGIFRSAAREIERVFVAAPGPAQVVIAVTGAAGAALGFAVLSIAWTILKLHRFRLWLDGDDLRLTCGLLTRRSATVPRHRIQLVSVRQSVIHRLFDRASVRIETAGAEAQGDDAISRRWLVPIVPTRDLSRVLEAIMPGIHYDAIDLKPLGRTAFQRMLIGDVISAIALGVVGLLFTRPWGALAIVVFLPLLAWRTRAETRVSGYARSERGVLFRSGVLTRITSYVPIEKVQVAATTETPLDRFCETAAFKVDTAGAGIAGHRIRIPYLPGDDARGLLHAVTAQAHEARFTW